MVTSHDGGRRHSEPYGTDAERRQFLKALGVTGAVTAGGATLREVRSAVSVGASDELAPIGRAIAADLTGELDAALLAEHQQAIAATTEHLTAVVERGFPIGEPSEEFGAVATAGRPMYEHLVGSGFFESTTEHLPAFDPASLESAVETFVGSEALAEPLAELGMAGTAGVDLLSAVVSNAEALSTYHWVATDEIPRERLEFGDHVPPMTRAATSGVLLWLADLDEHLWQKQVLLREAALADATWHARSMAAGLVLVAEGAKAVADGSGRLSNAELGALFSTGFAVQAIAQNLLPRDVYWITEANRAPRGSRAAR